MFETIGRFAARYRYAIIAIWVLAAAILTLVAPDIDAVASSNTADFLPDDAPFDRAEEVYQDTFPQDYAAGEAVIVFDASAAGGVLNTEAGSQAERIDTPVMQFIADFRAHFTRPDAPDNIMNIITPTQSATTIELLVGADNQVAMARVEMDTTATEDATIDTLDAMGDWLDDNAVEGVDTYRSGSAPIITNTSQSITTSVNRTIWVTLVLVVIILLVIYRSPVGPLVPLLSVTVAYLVTRALVAFAGQEFLTITSYANVILVVVMYGAGTDYGLFLISRFREEMAGEDAERTPATGRTVNQIGEAISSSATTIFVGFVAMSFAEMGIFNTTGPALALGIVLSLLAGLTFAPALLATFGQFVFWPREAKHRQTGRFYQWTSRTLSRNPLLTIVLIVAVMVPFAVYGLNQPVTYNMLSDLPDDSEAVQGFERIEEGLGAGRATPLTVVVTDRNPEEVPVTMTNLSGEIYALDGVANVRSLNSPLGQENEDINGLLRVDEQLRLATQLLAGLAGEGEVGLEQATQLQPAIEAFHQYLRLLEAAFPQVSDNQHFSTLAELFGNPTQMLDRRAEIAPALESLASYFSEEVQNPYVMPGELLPILEALPDEQRRGDFSPALLRGLQTEYIADEGRAFKLTVILAGPPQSSASMDTVIEIRDILDDYEDEGAAVVSGNSVINTDIRETMDRDLLRAIGFVLAGIFIVLLVMLRSVVAPLYLIATVLLSFTFTLGLTNLVFEWLEDIEGLTWYVPFFMFVFLVGLGVDYSIYLFSRTKEEIGQHGLQDGIHVAVARTGAIITSAGVILAGTFASMMTGEILGLAQLGFAVAVGVLIDTFVVRTVLVPALTTLFGRWAWWPGGVPAGDGETASDDE